jgi:DNA-binding NtrC family response regulator
MKPNVFALVVHDHLEQFKELEEMLKDLSVETWNIEHFNSAGDLALQYKPDLMFIESTVWDRLHLQLIGSVKQANRAPDIIVVGTKLDINLFVSSIERGAAGFIVPPFTYEGLSTMVHSATMSSREHQITTPRAA